jgi:mono/diheme cytochrome c family protein
LKRISRPQIALKRIALKKTALKKIALKKTPLSVLVSLSFAFALWAQKDQPKAAAPEYKIPPEAAAKQNPVKPGPESLAKGKKLYGYDCAMCHGKGGDGKGDMASDIKNVTDFTNPEALKMRSDGELFYITRNGKGEDMPPEGDRAKDDDVWNLVNYIRSFVKK